MCCQNRNEYSFKPTQVGMHVAALVGQIEDRVAYQLTRPVKGHIPSPTNTIDWHLAWVQHVPLISSTAQGKNRRMLKEQERILTLPLASPPDQFFLPGKGLHIFN